MNAEQPVVSLQIVVDGGPTCTDGVCAVVDEG